MYKLICQKPAHFYMAVPSSFLQVFILLGMYNFGAATTLFQAKNLCGCCFCPVCKLGLLLLLRPLQS